MKTYKIAVIPGDGIGKEVVPEGLRVLEAAGRRFGINYSFTHFDWSCETYVKTGKMMPDDGLAQLRPFDAIFLGAVGYPGVPDHISLWGLLIPIRRTFEQYVNLRPVRMLKGVDSPLKNAKPGRNRFLRGARKRRRRILQYRRADFRRHRRRDGHADRTSSRAAAWTASCASRSSWRGNANRT